MNKKTVFIIIIVIFIGSILVGFSSVIFKPSVDQVNTITGEIGNRQKEIETDVLTNKVEEDKSAESASKSMEGIVHKLDASLYMEGTHYLEVGGVTLALLESTKGVNLDKYIDKNVEVWGETKRTVEGDGIIVDVEKVENR